MQSDTNFQDIWTTWTKRRITENGMWRGNGRKTKILTKFTKKGWQSVQKLCYSDATPPSLQKTFK